VTFVTDGVQSKPYSTGQRRADRPAVFDFGALRHTTSRTTEMSRFNMMGAASAVFGRLSAARQRRRTMRILENLPDHIRKDIGWSTDRRMPPAPLAN
jgi:hypothetical protein